MRTLWFACGRPRDGKRPEDCRAKRPGIASCPWTSGCSAGHEQHLQCLEHHLTRLQSLTQLNQRISSSLHLDEVLHAIAQAAATLIQAPAVSFWLANEATQTLEFHSCSDERAGADW